MSRFKKDLDALLSLTRPELPPLQVVCPSMVVQVVFGFGYAASKGFRSTVAGSYDCQSKFSKVCLQADGLNHQVRNWTAMEELERSNYKDFCNLVETTKEECRF